VTVLSPRWCEGPGRRVAIPFVPVVTASSGSPSPRPTPPRTSPRRRPPDVVSRPVRSPTDRPGRPSPPWLSGCCRVERDRASGAGSAVAVKVTGSRSACRTSRSGIGPRRRTQVHDVAVAIPLASVSQRRRHHRPRPTLLRRYRDPRTGVAVGVMHDHRRIDRYRGPAWPSDCSPRLARSSWRPACLSRWTSRGFR